MVCFFLAFFALGIGSSSESVIIRCNSTKPDYQEGKLNLK